MAADEVELGLASQVRPDALGVPGQRRFRLLVEAQGGSACLWVEKEQLLQLGIAIKRLLAQVAGQGFRPPESGQPPAVAVSGSRLSLRDLRTQSLTLGYDRVRGLYALAAEGAGSEDEGDMAVRFWVNRGQLDTLADEAFKVCAAGRPLCPLCGVSLNPGEAHLCLRRNGHSKSLEFE